VLYSAWVRTGPAAIWSVSLKSDASDAGAYFVECPLDIVLGWETVQMPWPWRIEMSIWCTSLHHSQSILGMGPGQSVLVFSVGLSYLYICLQYSICIQGKAYTRYINLEDSLKKIVIYIFIQFSDKPSPLLQSELMRLLFDEAVAACSGRVEAVVEALAACSGTVQVSLVHFLHMG